MTNALRPGLPELPSRIRSLPVDARGFPVPWFVAWIDGKPDHRVVDASKFEPAIRHRRCWLCGQPLGKFLSFVIGPMCCLSRTISEPPSHHECAKFAAMACPFLSRPHAHRRDAGLPEQHTLPAGHGIRRNPGAVCVWTTTSYRPYRAPFGNEGLLFRIGDPAAVEWYCESRPATQHEVLASVESGLPHLYELAHKQDAEEHTDAATAELDVHVLNLRQWLVTLPWPEVANHA